MMLGAKDDDTRVFQQMAEALLAEDVAIDDLLLTDEAGAGAPAAAGVSRSIRVDHSREGDDTLDHTPMSAARGKTPPAPPRSRPATGAAAGAPTAGSLPPETSAAFASSRASTPLLEPYMRQSHRYEVDWGGSPATARVRPVRIFEVSPAAPSCRPPVVELGRS